MKMNTFQSKRNPAKNVRSRERNKQKRAVRRVAAETRNKLWQSLTPLQQLNQLDFRLGVNNGAEKQRKKILEKI